LNKIDNPNPIDNNKKVMDYFVKNRAIEFDLEYGFNKNKDYWNISDLEVEEHYLKTQIWTIEKYSI
jgi:hypothetical protein